MDQRGRKSLENLTVIATLPGQRPEPPGPLSDEEAAVWRAVVATKPSDWFLPDTWPLLADYCTACVQQEGVRRLLNTEECDKEKTLRLLDMLGKLKMALATKMRLSQQSRYRADAADAAQRRAGASPNKPWEKATG
jgi:hypothetical protein